MADIIAGTLANAKHALPVILATAVAVGISVFAPLESRIKEKLWRGVAMIFIGAALMVVLPKLPMNAGQILAGGFIIYGANLALGDPAAKFAAQLPIPRLTAGG